MPGLRPVDQSIEVADRELAPRQRAALVVVDRLELYRQRGIVLPVGQERAPHAHEIDLGLRDPAGRLVEFRLGLRTGDCAGESLDLGRERRIAQHRQAQAVPPRLLRRARLAGGRARTGARARIGPVGVARAGAGHASGAPRTRRVTSP
jgi:hypothetical protein